MSRSISKIITIIFLLTFVFILSSCRQTNTDDNAGDRTSLKDSVRVSYYTENNYYYLKATRANNKYNSSALAVTVHYKYKSSSNSSFKEYSDVVVIEKNQTSGVINIYKSYPFDIYYGSFEIVSFSVGYRIVIDLHGIEKNKLSYLLHVKSML